MENAQYENTRSLDAIKHYMTTVLESAKRDKRNAGTLPLLLRKLQLPADACERISFGDATRFTLVDRSSKCRQLRLILLFVALQRTQPGTHNLTGVFIAPAPDPRQYKLVQFIS